MTGIYKITIGDNFYFGSAVNLTNRRRQHYSELKRGTHSNQWMQRAFSKHQQFSFEIIETCDLAALLEREQSHISEHFTNPKCMNISPTAGNCVGVKHSEAARLNMSKAHIGLMLGMFHPLYGKPRSDETKNKIRKARLGKRYSEIQKANHSKAMRKKSTRLKISKAHTGKKHSAEHIEKRASKLRGELNPKSRGAWVLLPSMRLVQAKTLTELATKIDVRRIDLNRWLNGSRKWPGTSYFNGEKNKQLAGIAGGYLS